MSVHVQYVPPRVYCQLSTVNVKDSVYVFVCLLKRTMTILLTRGGTVVQSSSPVKSADRYSSTDVGQRRSERSGSLVRRALPLTAGELLSEHAAGTVLARRLPTAPPRRRRITVCDADTLLALPLSSAADSICLSLESQKTQALTQRAATIL